MALVDRLSRLPPDESPDPDWVFEGYISNHAFSAAVYLWGQGIITRAQVVTGLGLSAVDEVQLNQMKAHYDGLNASKKDAFHGKLEALGMLLELGYITKEFYKNKLALT